MSKTLVVKVTDEEGIGSTGVFYGNTDLGPHPVNVTGYDKAYGRQETGGLISEAANKLRVSEEKVITGLSLRRKVEW